MEEVLKKLDLVPQDLKMILIMAVVFAVFWRVIGRGIIQKYLDLFEAREKNTTGATSNAEENLATAQKLLEECEKKLLAERAAILKSLEPKLVAARDSAAQIVAEAEAKVASALVASRKSLEVERAELFSSLESKSEELAQHISDSALN
jgi:F0F1-type ATP synthase membrane subunit b/b'